MKIKKKITPEKDTFLYHSDKAAIQKVKLNKGVVVEIIPCLNYGVWGVLGSETRQSHQDTR